MSKYDNHIYLTICEVSLELSKKTAFSSYYLYCRFMGVSLNASSLSKKQRRDLEQIIEILDLFYSLNASDTADYIYNFFIKPPEEIREFEKCVMITNQITPLSRIVIKE